MSLEVRRAGDTDLDPMAEVLVLSDNERRREAGLTPTSTLLQARDVVASRMSSLGGRALVGCDGSHVMGMIMGLPAREDDGAGVAFVPGLLHVCTLAVMPESWGRRLGARMLTVLLDGAQHAGFVHAQLWTHESNARAIALYERLGFERSGRTKRDEDGERIAHWSRSLL
jgi:ribosomal protein S18 acetylase RimI-like enzyme